MRKKIRLQTYNTIDDAQQGIDNHLSIGWKFKSIDQVLDLEVDLELTPKRVAIYLVVFEY